MQKSRLKDVQANEVKLFCIEKAHQSVLENPLAQKYGTFEEQTRTHMRLVIKKTSFR